MFAQSNAIQPSHASLLGSIRLGHLALFGNNRPSFSGRRFVVLTRMIDRIAPEQNDHESIALPRTADGIAPQLPGIINIDATGRSNRSMCVCVCCCTQTVLVLWLSLVRRGEREWFQQSPQRAHKSTTAVETLCTPGALAARFDYADPFASSPSGALVAQFRSSRQRSCCFRCP